MEEYYWLYKKDIEDGPWAFHQKFRSYEYAKQHLCKADAAITARYWKIEKVWEWPF